ncbi:hypothetical protein BC828DRAFT_386466 [Blastocladiella britannica]|nr:hypothetical protein BC828DRAFT_386466 [Blastocladiella britannica]
MATITNLSALVLVRCNKPLHIAATTINHAEWGKRLPLPDYLGREKALLSTPMSSPAIHRSWALMHPDDVAKWNVAEGTDLPGAAVDAPILAACETFSRRAVESSNGTEKDSVMVSLGSVFVGERHRGRGYAKELMVRVREWMVREYPAGGYSNLYSDIGPKFYARLGWHVLPSLSLTGTVADMAVAGHHQQMNLQVTLLQSAVPESLYASLTYHALQAATSTKKKAVVLALDSGTVAWFRARSDHYLTLPQYAAHRPSTSTKVGATVPGGAILWSVLPEPSTLYILALRIDPSLSPIDQSAVRDALLSAAAAEARNHKLAKVTAYLSAEHNQVMEVLSAGWTVAPRDSSLSSLMVWGKDDSGPDMDAAQVAESVVWVGDERYAWV